VSLGFEAGVGSCRYKLWGFGKKLVWGGLLMGRCSVHELGSCVFCSVT
jgi:hypothetical protein